MITEGKELENWVAMDTAHRMAAAARTAPKTKGTDYLHTAVVTGEELEQLAQTMERLADEKGYGFFKRDAENLRASVAVVLIGTEYHRQGLGDGCQYCNFENCGVCQEQDGVCFFNPLDLGIAIGSAVGVAADNRVDNRVMFSVGRAAREMKLLGEEVRAVIGIPVSVSKKSPYFDRK